MTNRRKFIKLASLASAGLFIKASCDSGVSKYIGLQLYTVRDAMDNDPMAALQKVAKIGFNSLEGATYTGSQLFYGMKAEDWKAAINNLGLIMPSNHYVVGLAERNGIPVNGTILHGWEKAVDDAAAAGIKFMVCAYLAPNERQNIDAYKSLAQTFNKAGERCKKAGIQFCYHNHDFEFQPLNAQIPYEVLLKETDADLLKMELDLYWATKAKYDPVQLFNEYPGRFPLWHVKDMDNTEKQSFTEVGNGTIDFKRIFKASNKAGLKYFFVEQDVTPGSPFDSIRQSYNYINKNLEQYL